MVFQTFNQVGLAANTDRLAATAIRFLTTVCKSVHSKLFGEEATLKNIVESIVIPNLQVSISVWLYTVRQLHLS